MFKFARKVCYRNKRTLQDADNSGAITISLQQYCRILLYRADCFGDSIARGSDLFAQFETTITVNESLCSDETYFKFNNVLTYNSYQDIANVIVTRIINQFYP